MANDLVKRFIKKDGSQRISFYREDYAENPRNMTDEPLHCEDWNGNFSIMGKSEREYKSESARDLLEYMLCNYGDWKQIIGFLVKEGKKMAETRHPDVFKYNRHKGVWELWGYDYHYDVNERKSKLSWGVEESFGVPRNELDDYRQEIMYSLNDSTIEYFIKHFLTDKIKIASYSFGYNGEVSFSNSVDCKDDGIAWLEKDEFLKYSGHNEEYWNGKSLDEIEWLLDELEAWGNNDVYGFVVEDCIKSKVHKEYTNVDKEDEDYEEEEWEESDSCWGYYGDIDEVKVSMFDQAGLDINEFEEENV